MRLCPKTCKTLSLAPSVMSASPTPRKSYMGTLYIGTLYIRTPYIGLPRLDYFRLDYFRLDYFRLDYFTLEHLTVDIAIQYWYTYMEKL